MSFGNLLKRLAFTPILRMSPNADVHSSYRQPETSHKLNFHFSSYLDIKFFSLHPGLGAGIIFTMLTMLYENTKQNVGQNVRWDWILRSILKVMMRFLYGPVSYGNLLREIFVQHLLHERIHTSHLCPERMVTSPGLLLSSLLDWLLSSWHFRLATNIKLQMFHSHTATH